MKSLTKTAVFFVIALSLTLATLGIYSYFFFKVKNLAEQAIEINVKADTIDERDLRINNATNIIKSESDRVDKLSAYLIKESEIVEFTKKLDSLGKESGVKLSIESLEQGVDGGAGGGDALNFRLKVSGSFQNVVKFMALLENFPAKFDWNNVKFARSDGAVQKFTEENNKKNQERASIIVWNADISLTALNFIKE